MELAKTLMEVFDIQENPDKNDLTIVKRGLSLELTEARDIAGHIQYMTGDTTVAAFKERFEKCTPIGRLGNVIAIVSAHEECPQFLAFMKRQAKRLKFKLIVFVSPLPAKEIMAMQQQLEERGGLRMQ